MLSRPLPTVHLLCGLNASGKTTLAMNLAADLPAVRFSLDEWMLGLFDRRFDDPEYARARDRCTEIIWRTAVQVLDLGCDAVLDWNQWSRDRRSQWRDKARAAGYEVVLHFIDVPLEVALDRSVRRNVTGDDRSHVLSDEDIGHLASLFEPPSSDEMALVLHAWEPYSGGGTQEQRFRQVSFVKLGLGLETQTTNPWNSMPEVERRIYGPPSKSQGWYFGPGDSTNNTVVWQKTPRITLPDGVTPMTCWLKLLNGAGSFE